MKIKFHKYLLYGDHEAEPDTSFRSKFTLWYILNRFLTKEEIISTAHNPAFVFNIINNVNDIYY